MIRISLPYVIDLVVSLNGLDHVTATRKVSEVYGYVFSTTRKLDQFYQESLYASSLRSSRQLSANLSKVLNEIMSLKQETEIPAWQEWSLKSARDQFRTAFLAELEVMPSYFVTQKGGFDTLTLLDNASAVFPKELALKCPETAIDVADMGKALAFDLGTAASFHLFRILEAVLRRYFSVVTQGGSPPKVRTVGTYIRALEKSGCGDQRIIATLDQIKDLHRNPLIHPETHLSADQSISMIGIARSAIDAMLDVIPSHGIGGMSSMFANSPVEPDQA